MVIIFVRKDENQKCVSAFLELAISNCGRGEISADNQLSARKKSWYLMPTLQIIKAQQVTTDLEVTCRLI